MTNNKILLYRITHIENTEWLLSNGIVSINSPIKCPHYKGIGDKKIIHGRGDIQVPVNPFGVLNDYVPFYFAPRSPMLYWLTDHDKIIPENIIYLITSIRQLTIADHAYVFTDGHPYMAISAFYNSAADLNKIDWHTMSQKMWNNTMEDNDRQRRRQAELLVRDKVTPETIRVIVVFNNKSQNYVQNIVTKLGINITVVVRKNFYY